MANYLHKMTDNSTSYHFHRVTEDETKAVFISDRLWGRYVRTEKGNRVVSSSIGPAQRRWVQKKTVNNMDLTYRLFGRHIIGGSV